MDFEKLTDRARGFLQAAQTIAVREHQQRIAPAHLLKALLDDEQGMAAGLIQAAGGDAKAAKREVDMLDGHLAGLATVGSVSPYVGLFGTVWGIMNAFRGLANVSQATLAQVAPGIAEALIATAIGLFAAIPAVVAYNRFTHDVDRLATRYETFIEEFSNILQRQG